LSCFGKKDRSEGTAAVYRKGRRGGKRGKETETILVRWAAGGGKKWTLGEQRKEGTKGRMGSVVRT